MIERSILAAIRARLTEALLPPRDNYRPLRIDDRIVGWLNDLTGKSTAGLIFISVAVTLGAALVFLLPARSVNR